MIAAFGGSAYTIAAAPLLPWWAIAALAGIAALVLALGAWRRARGMAGGPALAMLLTILVNPSLIEEKRSPLRDVAVIVVDEFAEPADRRAARRHAKRALTALSERLGQNATSICGSSAPARRSPAAATTAPGCSRR